MKWQGNDEGKVKARERKRKSNAGEQDEKN